MLRTDNIWLHNTSSTNDCKPTQGGALFLYTQPATDPSTDTDHAPMISSRQLVIGPLYPRNVTLEPLPPKHIPSPTQLPCPDATTTDIMVTVPTPSDAENSVLAKISDNQRLARILTLVKLLFLWLCVCITGIFA